MICNVVINDFEIGRRMVCVLQDSDFDHQKNIWEDTDDLLMALQKHDLFKNRTKWSDLEIKHFHVMIVNILKMLSSYDDSVRADKDHAIVRRLTFFLCGLITHIQQTGCKIELLKVNRVTGDNVFYDYNASLEVKLEPQPTHTGLKVIIDNE